MRKIFVAVTFLCAMIFTAATASAENWVSFGKDNLGDEFFIDTDSVATYQSNSPLAFHAIFKTVFTDEGRKSFGYEKLGQVVSLCTFELRNNTKYCSTRFAAFYGLNGEFLEQDDNPSDWDVINPDSILELMYDTALSYLNR